MKPHGLGKERDDVLNAALESALQPIAEAALALGARREEARSLMADIFAHAAGLLLLAHTGRIRMFGASALHLMERFVEGAILTLTAKQQEMRTLGYDFERAQPCGTRIHRPMA